MVCRRERKGKEGAEVTKVLDLGIGGDGGCHVAGKCKQRQVKKKKARQAEGEVKCGGS